MKRNIVLALGSVAIIALLMSAPGCRKIKIEESTTGDVNIVGYLDKNLDSFSLFRQILERTGNAAFLNAYGAYTCFAPTNSGVKTYLAGLGAASVDAADLNTLKDMVRLHLLSDTVYTNSFTDGKLPVITMYGQYLVTSVTNKNGVSSYLINRQGTVLRSNVRVGNGIIHVIDNVLKPAVKTIAQQLEENPDYSIFVQALKETGFYTKLNTVDSDTSKRWMTVFAESNRALADSGFVTYAALKAKYSKTSSPTNANDSLHIYVAYHISQGLKFLGDIISTPTHETLQPQEVVSIKLIDQQVLLNQDEFNGVLEKGVVLNRDKSDIAATNGVWHDAAAHFMVKFRKPTALYWDVSSFDEIKKLPAYYKKANYTFSRATEADQPIKDHYWGWGPLASTNFLQYTYSAASSITNYAYNADINMVPLGLPNRPPWWEMRTPPIVKGKYKVWVCYRQQKQSSSSNMLCQVSVNGTIMQRTMNFTDTRPAGTDSELEAIGWKRYTENTSSLWAARQVGVIEFTTTKQQIIRITALSGTQNNNNLDMIHFIPIDQDQVLPRFRPDGTMIYQ
ncbi:putative surface protein with fasciclin (FAS1) repeats [Lacibacter cauensis]|uniref:Putative surface protein with fasciclin (FAS1) repeats n=1 Tax=Lacibacter cauensis TaxID=510947 RepID=A0A562SWL4_9BACT|nr:fasciclin domain-containing protein [Lacibacter cauensis]TWI85632.1 putative surface protein with fasciclin (FAS1) repeats [Lacibacter cauensis]